MMLCTAVSLPFMGRLVDRFGVKKILVPSIIIFGLCFLAASMISSYWQFIALYVAMGTIAVGTNSVPYMRVLTSWFDRRRGLAIGIAGSGTGLGFGYVPLITQELVSHYGWRGGYFGLGLIMLLFTLPMVVFLLHEKPQSLGLHPDGAVSDAPVEHAVATGDTLHEAMRRRDFWSLIVIFSGLAFVLYGLIPHMVPMLQDRGVPEALAAGLASAFGWSAFGGRLLIWLPGRSFRCAAHRLLVLLVVGGGIGAVVRAVADLGIRRRGDHARSELGRRGATCSRISPAATSA